MSKSSNSRLVVLVVVVSAVFSLGCDALKGRVIPNNGAACELPTAAEAESFEAYVLSTLPTSVDGWPLDRSPGSELPPGAVEAQNPGFYAGRAWSQGIICRACPELCAEGQE